MEPGSEPEEEREHWRWDGSPRGPKVSQSEPRGEPKGSQNGAEMEPKMEVKSKWIWGQLWRWSREPKVSQKGAQREPKAAKIEPKIKVKSR